MILPPSSPIDHRCRGLRSVAIDIVMGSGIALTDAAVMSTVLEGILYGVSLLMFAGTIWVLTQEKYRRKTNLTMILIAIILFILSTAHMIVDIVRIDEGLVKDAKTFPGGSSAFFEDVSQKTFVIKNVIYSLQTLLGDGVVIYRCYIVWGSVRVIILPVMLWCSVAVTAVGSVYSVSRATTNVTNIFAEQTGEWITAFYALTLTTNLLSSGLLAYRIWIIKNNSATILALRRYTFMPVVRVLVDAALLYSATLFAALVCFVNSNNGQYVVLDMVMPIISIAFYMVLIRVAMGRRKKLHYISSTAQRGRDSAEPQDTTYGMKPLQVHISQFSKTEPDPTSPCRPGNRSIEREDWCVTHKAESDNITYHV